MSNSFRRMITGLVVAGAFAAVAAPAFASDGAGKAGTNIERTYPGESYAQYYRRGGYGGGAVAAGVIGGLAVGALAGAAIAGSQPGYYAPGPYAYGPGAPVAYGPGAPVGNVYGHDPNWVNYCASKYRSFDPASGTYLARDGNRYVCQ